MKNLHRAAQRTTEIHREKHTTEMIRILFFLPLLLCQVLSAQLSWPEITKENKPWTRMWWPGSIGTNADITNAMEKYKAAGLGGVEVTSIYGVKGQEDKFHTYLSPEWMNLFTHFLNEGQRLNMGIDLANASGWPFAGPWIEPSDACRNINLKTWNLREGEMLQDKVEFIQQALVRPVGQKPDITKLIDPIARNKDLQLYALDQIRFEKPVPLKCLMAYSDKGETVDLTGKVNSSGILEWTAPSGTWTLYGLFEGWHGKMAERAGPGGEGDVIDHFSGKAIDDFLSHFDKIFKDYDISTLRGYFNDSYEVDDASGQANWTDDMFNEFKARRGYDLRLQLPALFQKDTPEKNARVLSDYRQTIADLILDKFTNHWTAWANKQGKITRNQSHGSPGNILDLYAASDIPETEGNELTKLKFSSSASNVTGKKLTSCEAATWLNEHFISTLADVKKAADLFFLGGINHLFYHGTCFTPKDEPWPGFLFYAAVEFTPANSFWNDFPALNNYIARVQSFMQQGKPDNDILLYFPIFDRFADPGRGMLEHFDAISPAFKGTPFRTGADEMIEKGYSFDYISDLQLTKTTSANGLINTEGNSYKTIVLPASKYIPLETFQKILGLASQGASVIFYGGMPENVSGYAEFEKKSSDFTRLKSSLAFKDVTGKNIKVAETGKGKIIMGADLHALLEFAAVRRETMTGSKLAFIRRTAGSSTIYFIKNQSADPFEGWVPLTVRPASAALFNPMTGSYGTAKTRITANGTTEIFVIMLPDESFIVQCSETKVQGRQYMFYSTSSAPVEIKEEWDLKFAGGGPVLPSDRKLSSLISWTETGGEEVKNFSGTVVYSIKFRKPAGKADAYQIDLGKVCSSARVSLNGKEIGVLIGPKFKVTVDKKLLKDKNTLEVKVSNLMANRIAYMDRNKIEWKKFYNINFSARLRENAKNGIFDASDWKPMESGLIGPVSLTPMKILK
jgi:hypothetical protein